MADGDSDDSDEWGMEELVIPPLKQKSDVDDDNKNDNDGGGGNDDDYWAVEKAAVADNKNDSKEQSLSQQDECDDDNGGGSGSGEPMIIIDITQMDPDIHSKFDRNSVNHPDKASALRKKFEQNYVEYKSCPTLLSEGTVIPCGSSVWRDALVRLRDDRPGHYFVPIFAPKAK